MKDTPKDIIEGLRRLISEEMFLLGQELEDSIDGKQQRRLAELATHLDEATDLLSMHRSSKPPIATPESKT